MLDDEFPTQDFPYVDDYDYSSDSDLEVIDELGQPELHVPEPRTGEEDFLSAKSASLQWSTHQKLTTLLQPRRKESGSAQYQVGSS
jgi:hypothetical protein